MPTFHSVKYLPILILIIISIFDLVRHRIPHLFLLLLAGTYLIAGFDFSRELFLFLVPLLIAFSIFTNVGMGDIKLLFLLGIFATPHLFSIHYLVLAWVIAVGTLLYSYLFSSSRLGLIPLAPTISLPLVAIYLGF